jgi:hypothetical protein
MEKHDPVVHWPSAKRTCQRLRWEAARLLGRGAMKLNHLHLTVDDVPAARRFLELRVGLRPLGEGT